MADSDLRIAYYLNVYNVVFETLLVGESAAASEQVWLCTPRSQFLSGLVPNGSVG